MMYYILVPVFCHCRAAFISYQVDFQSLISRVQGVGVYCNRSQRFGGFPCALRFTRINGDSQTRYYEGGHNPSKMQGTVVLNFQ